MADKTKKQSKSKSSEKQAPGIPGVPSMLSSHYITTIADEVAKTLLVRLPHLTQRGPRKKTSPKTLKKLEKAIFLDTSAIIDGRIFDVVEMGLFQDTFVISEDILLELKHIADSQDMVKRERGRKGLEYLEKLKKMKGIQVVIAPETPEVKKQAGKKIEVDEKLISVAKTYKGRILTGDYNLEKKANIQGVRAINVNGLANALKVRAVPGEALHIKVQHTGKDITQGVGYLDDGTMIVVEQGAGDLGKAVDVVVSRVIQTSAGRILFAKKI